MLIGETMVTRHLRTDRQRIRFLIVQVDALTNPIHQYSSVEVQMAPDANLLIWHRWDQGEVIISTLCSFL